MAANPLPRRRGEGSTSGLSVAVVQWTHTLRMKNALLLARAQLRRSVSFDHHIVLQSCGDVQLGCDALLAEAQPLSENVTCFTATDMNRLVPATHRIANVARGPHGGSAVHEVGAYRWCWYSCDAAYISWFVTTRPHSYDAFWFLEWDVTWTGDLAIILGAWNRADEAWNGGNASTGRTKLHHSAARKRGTVDHSPDMVCADPRKASKAWPHLHSRNVSHLHFDQTFMCVTGVSRVSQRLMRAMVAYAKQEEAPMFCEMRLPSVCALNAAWCTMDTLFDDTHQQYLFADQTRWVGTYTARISRADMESKMDIDQLWHGYQWRDDNRSRASFSTRLYDMQLAALNGTG